MIVTNLKRRKNSVFFFLKMTSESCHNTERKREKERKEKRKRKKEKRKEREKERKKKEHSILLLNIKCYVVGCS